MNVKIRKIVGNMHRHRTCAEWRQGARSHNQQAARSSAHEELWQKKTMTSAKVPRSHASNHIFTTRKSAEATILNARRCWNTPRDRSWRYCWWNWLLWCYFLGLRMMAGNASGSLQECPAVYPLALPTHDNYEVGKILNPLNYLSIGGKLKFTDLIGWANVDGMGWDRIGSDGMGSDWIGPRVEVFRTYHSHNHSYEYLRVTSFKMMCILICLLYA